MASITPRAWVNSTRMTDDDENDSRDPEHQPLESDCDPHDGRTPLDKTIDRIGMGSYQWTLMSLCGFGWMADNMWIQAVAIILPRVQQHYSVPDSYIGTVSSSMFAGMMFGAVGWGTCSDLLGRSTAFNATLFFTSLFGLLASLANSFATLCVSLFFLGSAVGGSMPTDGTLLLEHMPKDKQYFVTALSVFFSFGAVLSAVVALLLVPQHSCAPSSVSCNVDTENQGWKYLLIALGLITLTMFLARIAFFRLHESPRYLVHAGRPQEALLSLQMISRFNGSDITIELDDVDDYRPPTFASTGDDDAHTPFLADEEEDGQFPADDHGQQILSETPPEAISHEDSRDSSPPSAIQASTSPRGCQVDVKDYHSTRDSPTQLDSHTKDSPELAIRVAYENPTPAFEITPSPTQLSTPIPPRPRSSSHRSRFNSSPRTPIGNRGPRTTSLISEKQVRGILPRWFRRPFQAWLARLAMVLSRDWLRTTILVWSAWCAMALAYTMFNVYLPKLLETESHPGAVEVKPLRDTLWDVVIYTIGGCPGALFGAYLVESRLGRRWSLAGSTFITAFLCIVFVLVKSPLAVRTSTVGISLSSTTMWAVLYGWTPEIFGTKVRGTACGVASALSRIGGMAAPMLGGALLMIDRSVPVYTSSAVFILAGGCVLLLRENGPGNGRERRRTMMH